jgi:hypothetical protein
VAAERSLEAALVLGLELVVDLVGDPLAHLGQHRTRVECRRKARDDRSEEAEIAQLGLDAISHARVLHLDRDVLSVASGRPVDLPERGEGERLLVDFGEQLADASVDVQLAHASHAGRRGPSAPRRAAHQTRGAPARRRRPGRAGPSRGTA